MNGKKAKLLRGLAGVSSKDSSDRVYQVLEHTKRSKVIKNLANEVTHRFTTGTYILSPCARLLCKKLKQSYKKGIKLSNSPA